MEPRKKAQFRITRNNEKAVFNALRRFYILEIERKCMFGWDIRELSIKIGENDSHLEKLLKTGKFSALRRAYLKVIELPDKD